MPQEPTLVHRASKARRAAQKSGAGVFRLDDVRGAEHDGAETRYLVAEEGTTFAYWPHTPPEERREFAVWWDAEGNVHGGEQISGPPLDAPDD